MNALYGGSLDAQGRPVTLGVTGGGQLGRMFVHAAQAMGYATAVLDPDPTSPAGVISNYHIQTPYLDEQGLAQLMQRSSAITTEFENVPSGALITLGAHRFVAPDGDAVAVCQDRSLEKQQFKIAGVACVPYALLSEPKDLAAVDDALFPAILKTRRLGYDGRGQVVVESVAALDAAWQSLKAVPCILEKRVQLQHEVSVVVARGATGEKVHLPLQQNLHRDGILAVTQVPAPDVAPALQQQALAASHRIADALGYVGVLCVEFFILSDGTLLANEMAPRPHNSGHHSIDSCDVSQFALQVRTLAGLPLVPPRQHSAAVMLNLMGELWLDDAGQERSPDWAAVMALPGAHLHLYAKPGPRRGRKMGHLTFTAADAATARQHARTAAAVLGIQPF